MTEAQLRRRLLEDGYAKAERKLDERADEQRKDEQ